MATDPEFRPAPSERIALEEGYGIPAPGRPIDLWLNGNEGSAPDASLLDALADSDTEVLRRYPRAGSLEDTLAARHEVTQDNLIVTAGADESLDRICRTILEPGRELIVPVPTFEMFEVCARLAGGTLVEEPWADGPLPVERMLSKVGPRTAAIAVVTPNNPTGLVATAEDLQRLSAGAPDALLIVDLAYGEFAEVDLMPTVLSLPNAVALRTLSKAWGLAGLRVGYAVGPAPLIAWLHRAGPPFPVPQISRILAERRLSTGRPQVGRFVRRIAQERDELFELLAGLGARPLRSQGNFVFAASKDAGWLVDGLAGLGIAVRGFDGRKHLEDAVRITCPGNSEDFDRLGHGIRTVLDPEALLFDMDGVLADVSGSYRKAIVQTAGAFGIEVTGEMLTAAKAAGDANNDWHLTHGLLRSAGVEVPFEEVKRVFEDLYQGTGGGTGLWQSETLLCPVETLRRLADLLPLAVVTGRPRADTLRFLEHQGIAQLFTTLACLEDGPPKPDPAPVRLALQRLGVRRAWMIGDTPDDIRAARAARVLPLGLPSPGDRGPAIDEALRQAGAARILTSLTDLVSRQRGKPSRLRPPHIGPEDKRLDP